MKQKIIDLLKSTGRPGIDNLVKYLESTDFFTAPASTKYHGATEGGLIEHSMIVYENLKTICNSFKLEMSEPTLIICGLLHDVCKINFYKKGIRNVKNQQTGQWEQIDIYEIDDQFPIGHGEKSVIMLQRYIWLLDEEIMAIRWHMLGFDDTARQWAGGLTMQNAMGKYPLVTVLHMADLAATHFNQK